ncbi:MAG: DUF6478 family protein [Pseudomonadota bacterium]
MGQDTDGFWGRFGQNRPLRRWDRALQSASTLSASDLVRMTRQMTRLRHRLDDLNAKASDALRQRIDGHDGIDRPDQYDWAERAGPWRTKLNPVGHVDLGSPTKLGAGVTLFHDAAQADLSLRQEKAPGHVTGAAYGLILEVYRFDGSFVSVVQDLPKAALDGLTLNYFFSVHLRVETEQPLEIYARLNVQHGPNTEQIVRQFDVNGDRGTADFDLAYTKINDKRLEKAWIDIILEGPHMNRIALWDMVVLRAPRADV